MEGGGKEREQQQKQQEQQEEDEREQQQQQQQENEEEEPFCPARAPFASQTWLGTASFLRLRESALSLPLPRPVASLLRARRQHLPAFPPGSIQGTRTSPARYTSTDLCRKFSDRRLLLARLPRSNGCCCTYSNIRFPAPPLLVRRRSQEQAAVWVASQDAFLRLLHGKLLR